MHQPLDPVYKSGQVSYSEISLKSTRGETVDIRNMMQQIDLFEDLFANNLSGCITILDAVGFVSMFPVIGQETLTLKYNVVGSEPKQLSFVVYRVERIQSTQNADYVKLHFVSIEAYVNLTTVISKSFKGTASEIVEKVFKDYVGSNRPLEVEPSKYTTQMISPKWNPFYLINWLAGKSIPAHGRTPSYFFYETLSGFKFVALESKFLQQSVGVWKKQLPNASQSPNSTDKDKVSYNTSTIHSYELLEAFDFISAQLNGMIGSEMYIVDASKNGYRKVIFDYLSEFDKTHHLNSDPISSRVSSFGYQYTTPGVTRVAYNNTKSFSTVEDVNRYEEWVLQRMSFIQQMNGQRLQLEVAGNGIVEVGDVVDVEIPIVASSESPTPRLDPVLSGRYLITAIHHIFNLTDHQMVVEVSKDSTLKIPEFNRT